MTIYQRPIGKSISWIRFGLHNDTGRYTLMINRRSMQQIIYSPLFHVRQPMDHIFPSHYPKQLKQKLPDAGIKLMYIVGQLPSCSDHFQFFYAQLLHCQYSNKNRRMIAVTKKPWIRYPVATIDQKNRIVILILTVTPTVKGSSITNNPRRSQAWRNSSEGILCEVRTALNPAAFINSTFRSSARS